ncbi:chaperone modulator CbpM [Cytophaga hutchinsonii]|jgi:hypothetical protein|uniref:Transcriptional regulator, MerR family n=1 Tax=Cytophaga hutchinsonii (strain ATCC 33406 / DSM 1761 / CIP 103989 / NBRC 15051 / NCIMB 9469 / D465) TaxID=269798 RepID=A0A6N4SX63_CYTH3|nr:chaperone modulator CbpM [Cytophaga hutchinsonii]ABG61036.1 conserved hypothetical protein [Cytophaga hutchinsonii ATCC 33406]SFX44845.1 MerR HTH family regulatory protein [Cytophaga hutchinsonii ATCC 33406]
MNIENFIPVHKICTYYQVEVSFLNGLGEIGLIEINTVEEIGYIHMDQIGSIEKMIRMHHDLDVNIEGIDVVFNLLNKIEALQQELKGTRNRLKMYEG